MQIEISQNQHQQLIDFLAESVSLWQHEAATLLKYRAGRELGLEKLAQAEQAMALFTHLAKF